MHDIRYYIDEQVQALLRILENRAACAKPFVDAVLREMPDRLYLIGSGTSYNAALAATLFMEETLGMEVTAHAPSQLPVIRGEHPLIIVISQGGTSTNILRAVDALKGHRVLALTGREHCQVNEVCSAHTLLACGEEVVGPKTKGYTTTILTLYLMAMEAARAVDRMGEEAYEAAVRALDACFDRMPMDIRFEETRIDLYAPWLTKAPVFMIVGKGLAGLAAKECVIKLVETMLTPAMAYEFEEFLHGPVSLIDGKLGGIYLLPPEGDPDRARMLAVAKYHEEQAGRVLLVEANAGLPWYTQVFEQIIPCQLMAANLPAKMGVGNRGEEVFYAVDKLVDIKYGHVV